LTCVRQRLLVAPRGRMAVAAGIGCIILIGAAAYAALRPEKEGLASDPRQVARIQVMQAHLSTQIGPFIILAGDSHAERLSWDRVCGKPVVNLGLSGVTAIHYSKILARLTPAARADAMVVFLGTNDLSHKLNPVSDRSIARFKSRFESVIKDARRFAGQIVYAPLLPASHDLRASAWLATEKAPLYKHIATEVCLNSGCAVLDLASTSVNMLEDGVHADIADRRLGGSLHVLLEHTLCPHDQSRGVTSHPYVSPEKGEVQ
jgi:GDSL-like Lipase/Acylhydrolase family